MNITRKKIPRIKRNRPKVIQSGESTHHQDQSITLVNFRTIKTIVSRPAKPIPPPDDSILVFTPFVCVYHEPNAEVRPSHNLHDLGFIVVLFGNFYFKDKRVMDL